ncbi:protein FAM204A-like [Xenia sp. Carnegie-2017]|uniref:protein FAM204A-like n=1 Tax=Xenia sp. Carnegie-2017 TaxID=2897299 RepID=UPI001F046336|nr:protein FAM204A-like [Xenia sp. Carnegie-2017]
MYCRYMVFTGIILQLMYNMYSQVAPPKMLLTQSNSSKEESMDIFINVSGQSSCVYFAEAEPKQAGIMKEKRSRFCENLMKFEQLKARNQAISCKPLSEKTVRKRCREKSVDGESLGLKTPMREILQNNANGWKEICANIDANVHHCISKDQPKSQLEEKLDKAISRGNFTEAEKLSDQMSQEELAVKITEAISTRDYQKANNSNIKWNKSKRKKKLLWGFQQKERWESKGNM